MTKADRIAKLDEFTKGYLAAGLTLDVNDIKPDCILADITHDSLCILEKDCATFQTEATKLLKRYYEVQGEEQAGIDFWLTRNGHACGFWDRGGIDRELGQKLSDIAETFGRCSLAVTRGRVIVDWNDTRKPTGPTQNVFRIPMSEHTA